MNLERKRNALTPKEEDMRKYIYNSLSWEGLRRSRK